MTFRRDPHPSADHNSLENKPAACRPRNHHAPEPPPPVPTASNSNGSRGDPQEICLQELPRTSSINGAHHHHHHHGPSHQAGGVHAIVSYSPSSSGYSSIRCSSDNLCSAVHCHSTQFPYFNNGGSNGSVSPPPVGNGYASCNGGGGGTVSTGGCCYHYCTASNGNGVVSNGYSSPSSPPTSNGPVGPMPCCSCHACHSHGHGCCLAFTGKKGMVSMECRKVHVPSTIREESESYQSQRSKSVTSCKSYNA